MSRRDLSAEEPINDQESHTAFYTLERALTSENRIDLSWWGYHQDLSEQPVKRGGPQIEGDLRGVARTERGLVQRCQGALLRFGTSGRTAASTELVTEMLAKGCAVTEIHDVCRLHSRLAEPALDLQKIPIQCLRGRGLAEDTGKKYDVR